MWARLMIRARFSIAALAWFTAIVALAAALPRRHHLVPRVVGGVFKKTYLTREDWPLGWELLWRGGVVVGLCLIVWLFTRPGKGLPP